MNTSSPANNHKAWMLMFGAIIFWGINWPIMKIGLYYIGPIWFAALRVIIAAATLILFLGAQGKLTLPKREEIPILFSLAILQTGGFMGLIHFSLLFVEAGRSAVLAYTSPIWIPPLAMLFLGERLTIQKLVGIISGISGIILLFNPFTFPWGLNGYMLGNLLLIFAAMVWAVTIIHIRSHGWTRPHLSLLPWQFLIGGIILTITASAVEGVPVIPVSIEFGIIMFFNGVIATAFSFWAFIEAARILTANATAMGSLGVPVVGIVSSVLILGESISIVMALGAGMILFGIAVFTFRWRQAKTKPD